MYNLLPRSARDYGMYNFFSNFPTFPAISGQHSFRAVFKIDVEEKDDGYTITAELPGAAKEDVSVEFIEGKMKISFEKTEEANTENEQKNYIHRERRTASMYRVVHLPAMDPQGAKAALAEGVLTVTVPKRQDSKQGNSIPIE
ncbi:MAG: Hsp20/alpha crystallin family protein [Eubacteriaceae bacterium]|nr:Hsp20/alpha crystallin family protein [Eubacteriaceae bacterium]